jgi:hypothetical protein
MGLGIGLMTVWPRKRRNWIRKVTEINGYKTFIGFEFV